MVGFGSYGSAYADESHVSNALAPAGPGEP